MTYAESFLQKIEAFLISSGMTPTRFGIEAVKDPNLVFKLRKQPPRNCSLRTVERVEAFIHKHGSKGTKHKAIKKELNRISSINACE